MKKIFILVVILLPLLLTCEEDPGDFWALDFSYPYMKFYRVSARLLAENDLCYVWAENSSGVTEAVAQYVADTYKNEIYGKMMDVFGYMIKTKDEYGNDVELNTLQYVNLIAKGINYDGKLTILLLDIKDDYKPGVNDSYVAGYFWAGNLFVMGNSNNCDMIYVDTKPGRPGSRESNDTLSHELQHLMNFAGSIARNQQTDTWIDEGLSVTAEWLYLQEHSDIRFGWYNDDESGLIALGNNFFVWDNRDDENQYAVLDDYSTAYLFFQWIRLQSDIGIFKKISASKDYDYNAVINAFNDTVSDDKYPESDWEAMLKDWLAANYYKSSVGRYGYRDDTELNGVKIHYTPGGSTTINLSPGEGVYSRVTKSTLIPERTGNIYYAGLTGSSPVSSGYISSGALLTYNASTIVEFVNGEYIWEVETGIITGEAPPASSSANVSLYGLRSAGAVKGPFPISGGDMLRRNRRKNGIKSNGMNIDIPDTYKGIIINE